MDVCKKTDERNVKEVCAAVLRYWGEEESDAETGDTKVLKRKRHEPHVEGNFATFVYIPVLEDRGKIKEELLPIAVAKLQHLCEEALLRRISTAATRSGEQQQQPGEQQQQQQQRGEQQQDEEQQNASRQRQQLLQQQRHLPVEQQQQGASVLRQRQLMLVPAVENEDARNRTSSNGGASTASDASERVRSNRQSSFSRSSSSHSTSSRKSNSAASCCSNSGCSNNASSSRGGGCDINCGRSSGRSNSSGNVVRENCNKGFESSTIVTTRRYISDTSERDGYVSGSGRTSDTSACSSSSNDNGNTSRRDEDASSRTGGRRSSSRGRGSGVEGRVKKGDATGRRKGGARGTEGIRTPQQQQEGRKGKRQPQTPLQDTQDRRSAAFSGMPSPLTSAAAATASRTQLGKMQQRLDVVKEEEENFHISLCRTFMLQFHLIDLFVERMTEKLRHFRQFTLELERTIEIFSNQDSSCFFAAAPVTRICSDRLMTPLYEAVDEVVCAFGGLQFYQPAHPHLSLAWTLQNLQPVLDSVFRTAAEPPEEAEAVKRHARSNQAAGVAPEISTGRSSASGDHEGKHVRPPCGMVAAGDGIDGPLWLRVNCIRIRVGKVVTTVSLRGAHSVDETSSDELYES